MSPSGVPKPSTPSTPVTPGGGFSVEAQALANANNAMLRDLASEVAQLRESHAATLAIQQEILKSLRSQTADGGAATAETDGES